jgi:predicted ATPase
MRELAEVLEALTVMQPLVLVLEDLHWSDASTVDVLSMLAQRREAARLLVLGTYRPVELILRSHPLRQAVSELQLHGQCAELALRYLPPQAVAAYVAQRFPGHVSQAIAPVMYERTAGHPLFMVHLAEYLAQQVELDSGAGEQIETRTVAMVDTVPPGVQQLIELQLGRLRGDEQRVLEMASMAGAEFTVASVAAGVQMPLEHIEAVCADLLQRGPFLEVCGLALWPDGTLSGQYRFRHVLYQQVLYRRLSDVQRVQGHRRVGVRLEAGYGARANEIAAELAVHFGRGRDPERAVGYHAQASQQALARFAYPEAIRHLSTGLELLETLPDTPVRMQHELTLRLALGMPLLVSKGVTAPEVEQTYTRAAALAQQLGDASQQYRALSGLHRIMMSRPDFQQASELAQQCLSLARGLCDPGMLLSAHHMLGVTLFNCGELLHARATLVDGLRQYQPPPTLAANYRDPRIDCRNYLAWALWLLGYADQALQQHAEAMALAQTQSSSHDLIFTMVHAAVQHHLRREAAATRAWAEQVLALATEQAYTSWMEYGLMYHGWALTVEGHGDSGLATLRQGLSDWQRRGTPFRQPYFLALLADACAQAGQTAAGLQAVVDALEIVNTTGERFYEAELYRLKGELLTQTGARNEAEACLHQALAVARRQQARSWELRAAISLSRLWQQQGKQDAARELLTAIYGWFTEGFETMDVQEAQALLAELSQGWCAARSKLVPRQHICPPSPPVRPTVPQSN